MSEWRALTGKVLAEQRNGWRLLRSQSAFKWGFITLFALAFETGLMLLFYDGFRFLNAFGGAGTMLIGRLFSFFFMGLGIMLSISGIVTAYGSIFRSDEIAFLVTKPVGLSRIALYRFAAAVSLSSWAFFFIVVPFVGAYAWHERTSLLLPFWTFCFAVPFLFFFAGIGALAVLLIVRFAPRGKPASVIGGLIALMIIWGITILRKQVQPMESVNAFQIARMIPGLRLAGNPLMPSWWASEGIMAMAHGQWGRGIRLWGMLASTALLLAAGFEWVSRIWYYDAWLRVSAGQTTRRRRPLMLPVLRQITSLLPYDVRALVMKDVRTFLRDPLQWSQALVFFGLLALYFSNLRSFNYHAMTGHWRNVIAFLNVFSISAVLCSLGGRFIYPQLSLEGQGFWMLGLAPTNMRCVLLTKFMTSASAMLVVSVSLALLSTGMLNTDPLVRIIVIMLTAGIALAVCGLSTGLGAVFLDLDQRNPAAIVSGFGGTLNLVLSLVTMLVVILPFAALFHYAGNGLISADAMIRWLRFLLLGLTAIIIATTVIPLALGIRNLERKEF